MPKPTPRTSRRVVVALLLATAALLLLVAPAQAQVVLPDRIVPINPGIDQPQIGQSVTDAANPADAPEAQFNLDLGDTVTEPSQSLIIIILLTVLAISPSLVILLTSFTRIVIVLSITRNALGLPTVPPSQVVTGLALFLSLFIMGPTLSEMNEVAFQPLLAGEMETGEAFDAAKAPIREFMLSQVGESELALFMDAAELERPGGPEDVPLTPPIPAFILSELKAAFIIGFIVFVPFLVIDILTASTLMSMGMMMLPPTLISLPFKLLLFVLVDGWALVVQSLLTSFAT